MTVDIVYVFPANLTEQYAHYAARFVASYVKNLTSVPHNTVIAVNGGRLDPEIECLFLPLPNLTFLPHDNSGYDIGAFQAVSRVSTADVIMFFGASAYIRNPQWLNRVCQSVEKYGNALYGTMGNRGVANLNVHPHVRTTGFWLPPKLLNRYPHRITHASQRYEFEHGKTCLANWIGQQRLKTLVVTAYGEYEWAQWDIIPNGFHRGNQGALLVGDKLSEPPFYPHA